MSPLEAIELGLHVGYDLFVGFVQIALAPETSDEK